MTRVKSNTSESENLKGPLGGRPRYGWENDNNKMDLIEIESEDVD
jgi:hypothetical protein